MSEQIFDYAGPTIGEKCGEELALRDVIKRYYGIFGDLADVEVTQLTEAPLSIGSWRICESVSIKLKHQPARTSNSNSVSKVLN